MSTTARVPLLDPETNRFPDQYTPQGALDAVTAAEDARDDAVIAKQAAEQKAQELAAAKGAAGGIASLDGGAKLPEAQVPDRLTAPALSATISAAAARGGRCHILPATGQSNNTRADVAYPIGPADPRIAIFTPTNGIQVHPNSEITLTYALALEMLKTLPATDWILIVPVAVGSTQFTQGTSTVDGVSVTCSWDRTNTTAAVNLYARAMSWIAQAKAAVAALGNTSFIRAITFSGFEGDTPSLNKAAFTAKLIDMFTQMRTDLGDPQIPIVIGSLVPEYADLRGQTYTADIAAALAELPGNAGISLIAQFYGPRGYAKSGEVIHYSSAGQIERGRLAAGALVRAWQNRAAILPLPVTGLTIERDASGRVTASWEPPHCRVTGYVVEFSFDGGTTWIPGVLDPDSRLKATSGALPWESAQARVTTLNSSAATTSSVVAYSRAVPAPREAPATLTKSQKFVGEEAVSPAHTTATSLVAVYTHPASGGSAVINARKNDSSRQLLLNSTQSNSIDLAQAVTGGGTITQSFTGTKAQPGPHVTAVAISADGTTLTAKKDSAAVQTGTGAAGDISAEVLKVTASGGTTMLGAYIFYGVAFTAAQMLEAQRALAFRHGITMP